MVWKIQKPEFVNL